MTWFKRSTRSVVTIWCLSPNFADSTHLCMRVLVWVCISIERLFLFVRIYDVYFTILIWVVCLCRRHRTYQNELWSPKVQLHCTAMQIHLADSRQKLLLVDFFYNKQQQKFGWLDHTSGFSVLKLSIWEIYKNFADFTITTHKTHTRLV